MRTIFTLIALCCFLSKSWSQQLLLDSLNQLLINETDPYERIDLHLGLARFSSFARDNIQFKKNTDLALELSAKHNWPEAMVSAYVLKGASELSNGASSAEALKYYQKAIQLANKINDRSGLAFANYNLAGLYIYVENNPKRGLKIIDEALKKIDASVNPKYIGNIYRNRAVAYDYLRNFEEELKSYQQALIYFEKVKRTPFIVQRLGHKSSMDADDGKLNAGKIFLNYSIILAEKGEFESALLKAEKALSIYQSQKMENAEAWAFETLADIYEMKGDNTEAIRNFQKALKILESTGDKIGLISTQLALGYLFFFNEDYETALENFENGMVNSAILKDTAYLVKTMGGVGKTALFLGDTTRAAVTIKKAIKINEVLEYDDELPALLEVSSDIQEAKGNYSAAIEIYKKVLLLNKKSKDDWKFQRNLIKITHLFFKENKIDSARHYANLALKYEPKEASSKEKLSLQKAFADIHEKTGNYKEALKYHKNYFKLFEESFDNQSQKILKNEQVRQNVAGIEAEKKQAETVASLLASRNQLYLVLALGLGFALLMGSYLFRQLRKTKDQLESQNIQLEQLNTTRDKFFGIIAHDIRSPIVALDGVGEQMEYYLKKEDTKKLERLAGRVDVTAKRLNGLLDNLLSWALLQQGVIPFHPKSINVKSIGEQTFEMFEQNAKAKNISLKLEVEPQQKVFADEAALNTILRNLISNAIKFTPPGGTVSLGTEIKDDKVFINVNDTGTGISAERLTKLFALEKQSERGTFGEKGTGLGLTLVKELVELNNGSIDVTSVVEQGSSFLVGLPINP